VEKPRFVLIDSPDSDSFEKSGFGVYCRNVKDLLDDSGIPYQRICMTLPNKLSECLRWAFSDFLRTLSEISKIKSDATVHMTYEGFGFMMPFIKGRKIVTFHHLLNRDEKRTNRRWWLAWIFFAKLAAFLSDEVIAISPQTRKELIDMLRVGEDKIRVVMNRPSGAFNVLEGIERERSVGFVGSLIPRKNAAALIRSFSEVLKMPGTSDILLKICGKGPEAGALRELTDSLGITDRVIFMSDLSVEDLLVFYNSISVLANPSLHEGFGYVTLEAQRCLTPVVFFKHADIPPEVMRAAIPCTDEKEFANAIHRLLTDAEYWSTVSKEGKTYSDSFGEDYPKKMLDVYFGGDEKL
jgi:glycosyltransferase involved in cell wall biosynthesis